MAEPTALIEALKGVRYPGFSRDIVSFGLVKDVTCDAGVARARLAVQTSDPAVVETLRAACGEALLGVPGVARAEVEIAVQSPSGPAPAGTTAAAIPGVKHVVAVASGKGGVGKSTVAANLASAFRLLGFETGLCDCDMYGPSMGLMFDAHDAPGVTPDERIIPLERYGVRLMSLALLTGPDTPAILRGPMVTRFTQQFLRGVVWGNLDVLVLDLPPGTGDIQLTIVQTLALSGAVIVTTPQEVALIDARKAVSMFERVNVPVLGFVENMSYFLCPSDGVRYDIFGRGGGEAEAKRLGVPVLAQIPIDIPTRQCGDEGMPVTLRDRDGAVAQLFLGAAGRIAARLGLMGRGGAAPVASGMS
jgi:ATP-binding protein involved in chromosome partitioning